MKVIKKPVFEENLGLVWHVVNKYFAGGRGNHAIGYTQEDLFQIGSIGLMRAINGYDPEKYGTNFATYAVPTIWGMIIKDLRENGYELRAPRRAREIYNKIKNRNPLPTVNEIVKEFKVKKLYAELGLGLANMRYVSFDTPIDLGGKRDSYLHDLIEDTNSNTFESVAFRMELEERLSILNDRERKIIELTRKDIPQREIGRILGISQVQVSRILKKAIEKAKNYYEIKEQEKLKEEVAV